MPKGAALRSGARSPARRGRRPVHEDRPGRKAAAQIRRCAARTALFSGCANLLMLAVPHVGRPGRPPGFRARNRPARHGRPIVAFAPAAGRSRPGARAGLERAATGRLAPSGRGRGRRANAILNSDSGVGHSPAESRYKYGGIAALPGGTGGAGRTTRRRRYSPDDSHAGGGLCGARRAGCQNFLSQIRRLL